MNFQFQKTIFSLKLLPNAEWKSEETVVLKTTSLSIEKHKYLFMSMPSFTQQTPTKLSILVLSPGTAAFVTQQTHRTLNLCLVWHSCTRSVDKDMKNLNLSKAERSADQAGLSTVTPSCFLFRTANLNSSNQKASILLLLSSS